MICFAENYFASRKPEVAEVVEVDAAETVDSDGDVVGQRESEVLLSSVRQRGRPPQPLDASQSIHAALCINYST